jgi:hypothetical protein
MASEEGGVNEVPEFFFTRLKPENEQAPDQVFSVFLVQVKSNSEIGTQMLVDPLSVLRERAPEMGIGTGPDVRAQVLRVNAEVPANPVRRSEVWIVYSGSTNAVGIQYKYPEDAQA